jgi:hypothetical protein
VVIARNYAAKMTEKSNLSGAMVIGSIGGRLSYMKELALPFQEEVIPKLEDLGLIEADPREAKDSYPDSIERGTGAGPQNAFGIDDVLIGLAIYLGPKIADALIGDIVSEVYKSVVTPALNKLWGKIRKRKQPPQRISTTFDHWFDGSKVLIRVTFRSTALGPAPDHDLVRIALRDAAKRVQQGAVTHRVMTYEIVDGVLGSDPKFSEPV